jgi:hypothetical protein
MAIAVEVNFNGHGATMENYFKGLKILGGTPEGPHPDPACLFHWITEAGGGLRVTDVWKSKAAFEAFLPKVAASSEQVGLPKPQTKFIEVTNFATSGS